MRHTSLTFPPIPPNKSKGVPRPLLQDALNVFHRTFNHLKTESEMTSFPSIQLPSLHRTFEQPDNLVSTEACSSEPVLGLSCDSTTDPSTTFAFSRSTGPFCAHFTSVRFPLTSERRFASSLRFRAHQLLPGMLDSMNQTKPCFLQQ